MTKTNQKIPERWSVKKLGECLSLLKDGTHGTHQNSPDGIMLLSAKDVINGNILLPSDSRRISQKDFNMLHKNYHLQNDDVVLTIVGTIGRCAIIKNYSNNFTFQRSVAVLRPNKTIISKFLYILLQGKKIQNALFNRQSISAQPGVYLHDLSKISFNLPPLCEQEKIAEILETWDTAIEKLSALIEQKKQLKKGLMQRLLTGKQRLPGFSAPWKKVKLGDFLTFQTGFPFDSQFFNQEGIGIRLVKNRDLKSDDQIYFYSGIHTADDIVRDGDILVGMDGDFLPCLWKKGIALLNQRVGRVLCKKNLDHTFAYYALSSPLEKLQNETASTTVKHLSHSGVLKIKTSIPLDLSEQKAIADILSKADEEIALLTKKLSALKTQKTGLMQKLLTGQIRVKAA